MTPLTALQVSCELQLARIKARLLTAYQRPVPVLWAHDHPRRYVSSPKAWRQRRLVLHLVRRRTA